MNNAFIRLFKVVYQMTPQKNVRKFYYDVFKLFVRGIRLRKNLDGNNFYLDLGEKIDLALFLSMFERDLVEAIERSCKKGNIILDIGANIGAHTLRFGKIVGTIGRVYAFEPTDYAFKKLVTNVSLNPELKIECYQLALSDTNECNREINFRSSWSTFGKRKDYSCKVDFQKLDDWIKEKNIYHIDIIKLDVDGNEYRVLKGAEQFLGKNKPNIFMEVWGPNFENDQKNPFILLQQLGYQFYSFDMKTKFNSIDELRRMVSSNDGELLDYSFNIVASKH